MGDLFAAQFVCVGFHSTLGEGAAAITSCYKNKPRRDAKLREETLKNNISNKKFCGVQGPTAWGGEAGAFAPSRESLNCDSQLPARYSVLEPPLRAKSQELRANLKSPWLPKA